MLVPASQLLVMAAFPPEQRMKVIGAMAGVAGARLGARARARRADGRPRRLAARLPRQPADRPRGARARRADARAAAPRSRSRRPDLLGSVLAVAAVGALALGAVQGPEWGWGDPRTIAAFAASALLDAAAALALRGASRAGARAVAVPRRARSAPATSARCCSARASSGFVLANSLYLTQVWDYSVLRAGLAIAPGPLASAVAAFLAGALHGPDRPAPLRPAGRGDQRGRRASGSRRWSGAEPAFLAEWLPAQLLMGVGVGLGLRDDRGGLRARPRAGAARDRQRDERHDAPDRRGARRRDPDRHPRAGARTRPPTTAGWWAMAALALARGRADRADRAARRT